MRTLIKYHRCKRRQNPLLRLAGWHCWRCHRAFQGRHEEWVATDINNLREHPNSVHFGGFRTPERGTD